MVDKHFSSDNVDLYVTLDIYIVNSVMSADIEKCLVVISTFV